MSNINEKLGEMKTEVIWNWVTWRLLISDRSDENGFPAKLREELEELSTEKPFGEKFFIKKNS